LFNQFIVGPAVLIIDLYFGETCNMNASEAPRVSEYLWQFIFFVFMEDIGFYIAHSSLHYPQLYWIHKVHH